MGLCWIALMVAGAALLGAIPITDGTDGASAISAVRALGICICVFQATLTLVATTQGLIRASHPTTRPSSFSPAGVARLLPPFIAASLVVSSLSPNLALATSDPSLTLIELVPPNQPPEPTGAVSTTLVTTTTVAATVQTGTNGHSNSSSRVEGSPRVPSLPAQPSDRRYQVEPGDNLWAITEAALQSGSQSNIPPAEVIEPWLELIEANRSNLVDPQNPDLIYPEQTLDLPPQWPS